MGSFKCKNLHLFLYINIISITMINIDTYLIEKLNINKDIDEQHDWFQMDIAEEIDMPKWAYDYRKLKDGSKNRLWYAVYILLYKEGPKTVKEIINTLKPGQKSYGTRFMTELRSHGVIKAGTGAERGLQFPQEPKNWTNFVGNSYIC